MADVLHLEIATPERELVCEDVDEVQIPGRAGYVGILPGHAAMLGQLGIGSLTYASAGRQRVIAVSGGFLEVKDDNVRVLADAAERAEDINVERAQRALEKAKRQLADPNSGVEPSVSLEALLRAETRIAAAEQK